MSVEAVDVKLIAAAASFIAGTIAYVSYFHSMFAGHTKPHAYTWLIWTITMSIAAAGLWYGGGGYAAASFTSATVFTAGIFLMSLRFGTKNVTRGDAILLALALTSVIPWVVFKEPLLSILMVTAIDVIGYLPSMRKSFEEPWSESLLSWYLFTFAALFLLLALDRYTLVTTLYIGAIFVANVVLLGICLVRRRTVLKPPVASA